MRNFSESAWSTFSASATVSVATRWEWPEVVGSRDSIAFTLALMKPSNSVRIELTSWVFWMAMEACEAMDMAMRRSCCVNGWM